MSEDLALAPFVKGHPPREDVQPASEETIARYAGRVPDALLDLWRTHGFGHYGERQLELIDPTIWQETLDRWIVSPPSDAVRVPFMLTPFGILVYYRRLSDTDEDVAMIDPFESEAELLTWSLVDYFNDMLLHPKGLEGMVLEGWARVALEEKGPLAPGQIYEVDRMMLTMQMMKIDGPLDALAVHKRLRDAVDQRERAD